MTQTRQRRAGHGWSGVCRCTCGEGRCTPWLPESGPRRLPTASIVEGERPGAGALPPQMRKWPSRGSGHTEESELPGATVAPPRVETDQNPQRIGQIQVIFAAETRRMRRQESSDTWKTLPELCVPLRSCFALPTRRLAQSLRLARCPAMPSAARRRSPSARPARPGAGILR